MLWHWKLTHRQYRLSAELIDFAQYLEPTATEKRDRSHAFNEIKRTIEREIESSEVHAFGSYETGLLLPSRYVCDIVRRLDV